MVRVYVTNTDSDDVSVVNLRKRREIGRISVGGSPRGSVRFDPDGEIGYVSNCAGNTISVLDLKNNLEVERIRVGLAPRGLTLSADGRYAYVSNSGESSLSVVNLKARREVKRVVLGHNPRHMAYLSSKNRLLVSQWGADSLASIDLNVGVRDLKSAKAISVGVGARPYSLTANKAGDTAYVANTQADYLSIIDIAKGKEKSRVTVGFGGRAVVLSEDESYAFVSTENTNDVAVVELASDQVVHRVEVGPSPRGIALSASTQELVASAFTRSVSLVGKRNSVSIINVADPRKAELVASVSVGLGPCSVSILQPRP